jgi:DNA-binding transcriptional LysR family regulator
MNSKIQVHSTAMAAALTSVGMGISIIDQYSAKIFPSADIAVRALSQPIQFQVQALMKSSLRLSAPQEFFLSEIRAEIKRANQWDLVT